MAIDASIALGIKPVQTKSQNEYMNELYALRNAEQTNQMNQMKMGETQRAQAQAEDTRNFFRQPGFNVEKMTPAQDAELAALNPDFYEKLKSKQTLQRTQESETAKRSEEIQGMYDDRYANMIKDAKTPEQVDLILEHRYKNPALKGSPFQAIPLDQIKANVPRDLSTPEGQAAFSRYTRETSLKAKDAADSKLLHFFGTGGGTQGQGKYSDSLPGTYTPNTPTTKEKLDYTPKYLAEVAERDKTADDIKKTEALYNNASGTPMREVYGSQLKDYYTRLEDQDKRIAGMKADEAANKKAFEFKTLVADVAKLEAAGEGNSPTAQRLKARIAKETYIPPASMDLSPDQNAALYGPNGSVTQGRLDPYKVNGRTAKVYANAEITNPGTNFNQLGGAAALNRNAQFMGKQLTIEMLPKMLSNMSEAGKKLNFNDNKYFGAVQAWYKGASNDPDFISYMAQRNDVLLTLMGAMRSVGASDLAHRAEIDAAPQNMSPRAFDAYVAGQYKALEPRLAQAAKFTGSKPPAETSNAPAKTVTGQTVKNW